MFLKICNLIVIIKIMIIVIIVTTKRRCEVFACLKIADLINKTILFKYNLANCIYESSLTRLKVKPIENSVVVQSSKTDKVGSTKITKMHKNPFS